MFGSIFTKIARKVVDTVLGQLTKQISQLDDFVRAPMQAIIDEIVGGVWVGDGADAFVNELSSIFIPGTDGLKTSVSSIGAGINKAIDIMDQADNKAQSVVDDLVGVFDSIF